MVPYSSTPTVEIVMTLSLSFTLLFGTLLIGFMTHKFFLFTVFLPGGTPIILIPLMILLESLAYVIKIISLGLRLAINLTTGHVLTKVLIGFIWTAYLQGVNVLI
jgi:F-type H+-transporting ATPase subunit a